MPMFLPHNLPRLRLGLAALLLAVWGLVGARAAAAQEQVLVIANTSVPADSISKTQLLDFYTGEVKLWDNGERVVVFRAPGHVAGELEVPENLTPDERATHRDQVRALMNPAATSQGGE